MLADEPAFDLGDYVRQRGASDLETQILRAYFDLDKDTRQKLLENFKALFSSIPEGEKAGGETVAEAIAETVSAMVDIDAETASYRADLILQEKAKEKLSASDGHSDTCEGKMA